jgi:hypothetical protein
MKTISQNPDRYSKVGNNWVISASKDIKPIQLPIGVPLKNLKPFIKADGVVVKVNEDYLCSTATLSEIKNSMNPHYDIVENGTIKVKDKVITIGKTIKIIELDISRLKSIGDLQDTKGVKAGVSSVDYIYEGDKTDGVSNNLITQINYTLTQDSARGIDKYNLYFLKLAPDEAYSINALETVKQPENELLDMAKLKVFSEGVRSRLVLLREDFNMIKKMFFEGLIPVNMGKVEITNTIPDPLKQLQGAKDYHQVIYKEVGAVQRYVDTQGTLRGFGSSLQKAVDELKQQSTQQVQQQAAQTQQQLAETQKKLSGK